MGPALGRDGTLADRLRRLEGQVRGIERMVDQRRPCPEILIQLAAARGALDEVGRVLVCEYLRGCLWTLAKTLGPTERERRIRDILAVLGTTSR